MAFIAQILMPPALFGVSIAASVLTLAKAIVTLDVAALTSISTFRDKSFAMMWPLLGAGAYEKGKPHVATLLPQAHGRVLDVGTGAGHFLHMYDRSKITKLYLVEPNPGQHPNLRKRAMDAGLDGIFELISVTGEELQSKAGIEKGSIDTVVTLQVLCSVSDPQGVIESLYSYLKPGGLWIVYEHVCCWPKGTMIARYQAVLDIAWPYFFNGCCISRDSVRWIKAAGPWSSSTVGPLPGESTFSSIPHWLGVLRK